jgi:hypothetical protein
VRQIVRPRHRRRLGNVVSFIYRVIVGLFAKVSWVARAVAILAPHYFLYYRGVDAPAYVPIAPELNFFRLALAITLSLLFAMYFAWDALADAGRLSKTKPHLTGQDWDHDKAAMEDDAASSIASAWVNKRPLQIRGE